MRKTYNYLKEQIEKELNNQEQIAKELLEVAPKDECQRCYTDGLMNIIEAIKGIIKEE